MTSALQTLPDSTLRWLAASSIGLGAGFYLAGKRRLTIAAVVAPVLVVAAAIALRPTKPIAPAEASRGSGASGDSEYGAQLARDLSRLDDDGGPSVQS